VIADNNGGGWTEVLILASIVVPVVITAILVWVFLRGGRNDPDEQRLKRVQREWRENHDRER
jgi:multisubunit Na+/H+ antiporter MnhC subunit